MRKLFIFLSLFLFTTCSSIEGSGTDVDIADNQPFEVESPVRVHLIDGSSVFFEDGLSVANGQVSGEGILFDQAGEEVGPLNGFPLEDVAAMESYVDIPEVVETTAKVVAVGAIAAIVIGALALAIFGSCPTIYSLDADVPVLEAELFSYNIAPAFQSRDVDRLGVAPTADGRVSLEIRNEMLETHYIDQLELLEVTHEVSQSAFPGRNGRPIVTENPIPPVAAVDQDGRDILSMLHSEDQHAWSATDERLARVTEADYTDHLYLEFDVPAEVEDPALILRMRNSMLNTELFYGAMLEDQGFAALDWMGKDLKRLPGGMRTALWFRNNMGMDVEVWSDGRYRKAGHIMDQGPIAWAERALRLRNVESEDGKLKLRLSFVADNWRIDQVSLALESEVGSTRIVPVSEVESQDGIRPEIPAFLAAADKEYLINRPTDRLQLHFDTGAEESGKTRSFFLASNGYYIEWMRADWLTGGQKQEYRPGKESLLSTINRYAEKRDGYREAFESTKIEVR